MIKIAHEFVKYSVKGIEAYYPVEVNKRNFKSFSRGIILDSKKNMEESKSFLSKVKEYLASSSEVTFLSFFDNLIIIPKL